MSNFPGNKKFAFTIFDDTDLSTVQNVGPVYRLLENLGMRTTKSVWPLASVPGARYMGQSLQEPDYLQFVLDLQKKGFEIALHNVRNTHSTRDQVKDGFEAYRRLLGQYPRAHANHSNNADGIYWGAARFSTAIGLVYRLFEIARRQWLFAGHQPGSPYYWADICRSHIDYTRNFVFDEINLDLINPTMPYHDPRRPYVNAWFSSADGADVERFCGLLCPENQDRLESEGGVCIVYAHFACGFARNGEVDRRVESLLSRLARKAGWFVPVSTLLDFLRDRRGTLSIPRAELARMERRWMRDRFRRALSRVLSPASRQPVPLPDLENAAA
jgi:hypothetical protein